MGVEEGVDIGGQEVDDGAQGGGVGLEDVHGLGGGDGARVARRAEGRFGAGDESRQAARVAVAVEDGLVAHDEHFHGGVVPPGPGRDVGDLAARAGDARVGDEDAQHEFQAQGFGRVGGVGETVAVRAVETHGGEALGGEYCHVGRL